MRLSSRDHDSQPEARNSGYHDTATSHHGDRGDQRGYDGGSRRDTGSSDSHRSSSKRRYEHTEGGRRREEYPDSHRHDDERRGSWPETRQKEARHDPRGPRRNNSEPDSSRYDGDYYDRSNSADVDRGRHNSHRPRDSATSDSRRYDDRDRDRGRGRDRDRDRDRARDRDREYDKYSDRHRPGAQTSERLLAMAPSSLSSCPTDRRDTGDDIRSAASNQSGEQSGDHFQDVYTSANSWDKGSDTAQGTPEPHIDENSEALMLSSTSPALPASVPMLPPSEGKGYAVNTSDTYLTTFEPRRYRLSHSFQRMCDNFSLSLHCCLSTRTLT